MPHRTLTIRVVLASRSRLEQLDQVSDILVVTRVGSMDEAAAVCRRARPEVLVLDLSLPGGSWLEVVRLVSEGPHPVPVVALGFPEEELFEVASSGVRGLVSAHAPPQALRDAIRAVQRGLGAADVETTGRLVEAYRRLRQAPLPPTPNDLAVALHLSPRELEVLQLLIRGCSNREIADRLVISEKTAKTHVANILKRTGTRGRLAAALLALRHGLQE